MGYKDDKAKEDAKLALNAVEDARDAVESGDTAYATLILREVADEVGERRDTTAEALRNSADAVEDSVDEGMEKLTETEFLLTVVMAAGDKT